jgi:hypothetical protein
MRIIVSMQDGHLGMLKNDAWLESVGGLTKATLLIRDTLDCGLSKAEKIAAGRYPSELSPEEVKKLNELIWGSKGRKRHALVGARAKRRTA